MSAQHFSVMVISIFKGPSPCLSVVKWLTRTRRRTKNDVYLHLLKLFIHEKLQYVFHYYCMIGSLNIFSIIFHPNITNVSETLCYCHIKKMQIHSNM